MCQKSCLRWRRLSGSIPGEPPLEALDFADRAERRRDMPLDLPKYLRAFRVIPSIWRRFRRSPFTASVPLLSSESSPWPPGSLCEGKGVSKGEPSFEESPVGSGWKPRAQPSSSISREKSPSGYSWSKNIRDRLVRVGRDVRAIAFPPSSLAGFRGYRRNLRDTDYR
jgi:hypothetical protein